MTWLAGTDGCPAGWLCIRQHQESGELRAAIFADAAALLSQKPLPAVLGIDMPIGLTDSGPRTCDQLARQRLGWPRSSSVFTAPIRPALAAGDWSEAAAITERIDGKRIAKQAWGIYPKIRELDLALRGARMDTRDRVREVHPELAFQARRNGLAIQAGKRTKEGRAIRLSLIDETFGSRAFPSIRKQFKKREAADDDILDALIVLWSARRIHQSQATILPDSPPRDRHGLPMEIIF